MVIIVLISFREKMYSSKSANLVGSGANMQSYRRKKIQCEDFMDCM